MARTAGGIKIIKNYNEASMVNITKKKLLFNTYECACQNFITNSYHQCVRIRDLELIIISSLLMTVNLHAVIVQKKTARRVFELWNECHKMQVKVMYYHDPPSVHLIIVIERLILELINILSCTQTCDWRRGIIKQGRWKLGETSRLYCFCELFNNENG